VGATHQNGTQAFELLGYIMLITFAEAHKFHNLFFKRRYSFNDPELA